MFRRTMVALSIVVPILAMGAGVAISQRTKDAKRPADLSGEWRLDPSRSDLGPGRGARGGWMRGNGSRPGGRWEEGGSPGGRGPGMGGRESGGGGRRGVRLPEWLRIEQAVDKVSIADSTGRPLEQITTGQAGGPPADGALPSFRGEWKKGSLEVVREGPRGRITETFSLEEDGRTLVIQMKMESSGPRPSREFKRVYRRVST